MPITPSMQAQVSQLSIIATSVGAHMVTADNFTKMFHLLAKFQDNPSLFEDFKANPQRIVLQELGAFGSAGTHFHTADENNSYIPPEAGAADQIMQGKAAADKPWVRIEVRAGIGPLCWISCGICDNKV